MRVVLIDTKIYLVKNVHRTFYLCYYIRLHARVIFFIAIFHCSNKTIPSFQVKFSEDFVVSEEKGALHVTIYYSCNAV